MVWLRNRRSVLVRCRLFEWLGLGSAFAVGYTLLLYVGEVFCILTLSCWRVVRRSVFARRELVGGRDDSADVRLGRSEGALAGEHGGVEGGNGLALIPRLHLFNAVYFS